MENMNKKILCILISAVLAAALLFTGGPASAARKPPDIVVNGVRIDAGGAYIENGVTYVPLRAVSEGLGAMVNWDEGAYTVNIELAAHADDTKVSDVISEISPSVVAIVGTYSDSPSSYKDRYSEGIAHGTGVIIKSGGDILTNAHVVDGLRNIVVVLHDGSAYNGAVRYVDTGSDLAVVKIDRLGLPIVTFADHFIAGETVVALGTPLSFSLRNSASKGIISGVNRGMLSEYALIQTDAAINRGNSGGPLVNMNGQVVGINSRKFEGVGIEGIGFSIPSDTVTYVLNQFYEYGEVRRAGLDASLEEGWAARYGLPTKEGLKVLSSAGTARAGGLLPGDEILSIGGANVHSHVDFNECMKKYKRGESVELIIRRGAEESALVLTLE